ncbi:MAG TPA: DUF6512 family protein [Bacillota bacterium]|nr:DUF6512 family protein [Bacillota bacterium]
MKYQNLSPAEQWILKGVPYLFLIGSGLHFIYELTGKNPLVGLLAPVNESVWEHLKLVLIPVIGWWTVYYLAAGNTGGINKNNWFTGALTALMASLITIPLLYYFYTQAFGVELIWVDILILLLAVLSGQLVGLHWYRYGRGIEATTVVGILITIILLFMLFTFTPPQLPLFRDPTTGQYGIYS